MTAAPPRSLGFPNDTLDHIEKKYASLVLSGFPRYGKFWELFIGGRTDPKGRLRSVPYGLLLPKTLSNSEKRRFERSYEEMAMAHYALFWKLISVHNRLDSLKDTLNLGEGPERFFKHFENFDAIYYHLSCCINQVYHLWGLLLEMKGEVTRTPDGQLCNVRGAIRKVFQTSSTALSLFARLEDAEKRIDCYRDNIVHFAYGITLETAKGYYVDAKPKRNQLWSEQSVGDLSNTVKRAEQDLRNLEKLLNDMHEQLIIQVHDVFSKKGVAVGY